MKIPEHLRWPETDDQKKRVVALVKESRSVMSKAPAFDTTDEAVDEAVKLAKKEKFSFPSVWKEPQDIGTKYAVVHTDIREEALNAGYTEEIDEQKIFNLTRGVKKSDADWVEEVD